MLRGRNPKSMSESIVTATPRELAAFVAGHLGAPVKTALEVDRQLREAGLRSSRGRGPSAARATADDAARLIIALVAVETFGPSTARAVELVERYGALPYDGPSWSRPFSASGSPILAGIVGATFGDALAAVIDATSRDVFSDFAPMRDHIRVAVLGPWPSAEIFVAIGGGTFAATFAAPWGDDAVGYRRHCEKLGREFGTPDVHQTRTITHRTILEVGALLRGEDR